MTKVIRSEMKIREEFNECRGREAIESELESATLDIQYVDLDNDSWKNDGATMVFMIRRSVDAMLFTRFVHSIRPDEFDWVDAPTEDDRIVRLWWD